MRRFFTLLFCIPFLCAVTKKSIGATADVLVQTIPKGGSHLLVNILEEMSNEKKLTFYWAHFSQGQWYKTNAWIYSYLLKHQAKKKIVMVRDYRDVIVSLMHYLDQAVIQASIDPKVRKIFTWFHLTYRSPEISVWKKLKTQEQKIDHLLDPVGNFLGQSLYQAFFDSQNLWKTKNTLFLRYEDFIDGNGDEQVARVAKFVHRKPFPLSKVYGGLGFSSGGHFRNGKSGEWKKYFSEKQKKLFKKQFNHFLIRYGYESDANW